jgi:hypothetical protein
VSLPSPNSFACWRDAIVPACDALASAVIGCSDHRLHQFAALLLIEGYCASTEFNFQFEEPFDCWACGMTGAIGNRVCPECSGRGYKRIYVVSSLDFVFTIERREFVCASGSGGGLVKNYSQSLPFWENPPLPDRARKLPLRSDFKGFDFYSRPPQRRCRDVKDVLPLLEWIIGERKAEIRKTATQKAAATRKRKKEGGSALG